MAHDPSKSGMSEEPAEFDGSYAHISEQILQYAEELGIDVKAIVQKGGSLALEQELRRVFYRDNAEPIRKSGEYIRQNGSLGQRFGIFPSK